MVSTDIKILSENIHLISREQAWHYHILPKEYSNLILTLYCADDVDERTLLPELEVVLGKKIRLEKVSGEEVLRLLSTWYFREKRTDQFSAPTAGKEDFLDKLINDARSLRSSDIHIECYEFKCRVRVRIDGMMVERYLLNREEYPSLVNKIKILANMDIAEKRLPQDGRIQYTNSHETFDVRASVLPTLHGEKVVLRLLNNSAANIDLDSLGFSKTDYDHYMEGIKSPNGILLISGPTGSGKTTTLYASLKYLNRETRNILTIEDPIEYTLQGINQVQLKESIGLTFSSALRTFLRQDPDIIMVGEIRDPETANMAIRAALTGHLVLSTIHTNSAWGTVSRLIDMEIPAFLVASTLNTTVAQRLLRLLCPACKLLISEPIKYPRQFKPYFEVSSHFGPGGCDECFYTGYKGRRAVYEVINIDEELASAIKMGANQIESLLRERGVKTIAQNSFELFANGQTSLEEIYPLLMNN